MFYRFLPPLHSLVKPRPKLSLVIVTYNEEQRIEACLRDAAPWVDEIILVDQSSTDRTLSVAQETLIDLTCAPSTKPQLLRSYAILDQHHGYCEASRAFAASHQTGDWSLVIDADETLSESCKRQLRNLIQEAESRGWDGYRLKRVTSIEGEFMYRPDDVHFRLYRKRRAVYLNVLHSAPQPLDGGARLGPTPEYCALEHHKTLEEQLEDELRYERIIESQNQPPQWKAERLACNVYLRARRERLPAVLVEEERQKAMRRNPNPELMMRDPNPEPR